MIGDLLVDLEIVRNYGMSVGFLMGGVYRLFQVRKANENSECYYSMKEMAEVTGMGYRQLRDAAKKAKEAGLVDYRSGYKPGTTEKTTYWELLWEGYNELPC